MLRRPILVSARVHIVASVALTALQLGPTMAHAQAKRPPAKAGPAAPAAPAIKPLIDTLTGDARTDYQAGTVLFGDGDYATALQKFNSAHAKQPDPRLLYNMASAEKSLRHYATAAKLLRRYLAEGGALLTNDDRRDAEELVKVIEALTLPVTINVSEPGAQVFLDDELLGLSPLPSGVTVDIGQRKLRAQKDGFRPLTLPVQIGPAHVFDLKLERLRGRLELKTKVGATVYLDDKPIGSGPLVVSDELPVGGHALRITAPRMRTYQGEVVLEDGKARSLDIELEPDLEQVSEVRVAVGCADPRIRTPEEGLSIFFDDAQVSASPLGVRKRVEDNREVPAYVPFTVAAGEHRVRVRFPGCDPLETMAVAAPASAVDVTGMLPAENPWFNGTPAGSPNGFRVSAGVTISSLKFSKFQNFFDQATALGDSAADVSFAGPSVSVGTQTRWFMGVLDARYVFGDTSGSTVAVANTPPQPAVTSASQDASLGIGDLGIRLGPRIPINVASIAGGGLAGIGAIHVSPTGPSSSTTDLYVRGGFWAGVEAQPLCDFSLGVHFSLSAATTGDSNAKVGASSEAAWNIHIGYQPNVLCRRKRAGLYRVQAEVASSAVGAPSAAPASAPAPALPPARAPAAAPAPSAAPPPAAPPPAVPPAPVVAPPPAGLPPPPPAPEVPPSPGGPP
jgi:hypothetical protein